MKDGAAQLRNFGLLHVAFSFEQKEVVPSAVASCCS